MRNIDRHPSQKGDIVRRTAIIIIGLFALFTFINAYTVESGSITNPTETQTPK